MSPNGAGLIGEVHFVEARLSIWGGFFRHAMEMALCLCVSMKGNRQVTGRMDGGERKNEYEKN